MKGSGRFSPGVVTSAGDAVSPAGGGAVVTVGDVVEVVDELGIVEPVVVEPAAVELVVAGRVVELVPTAAADEQAPSTTAQPAAAAARRSPGEMRGRGRGDERWSMVGTAGENLSCAHYPRRS
jgi:hypothetical protein